MATAKQTPNAVKGLSKFEGRDVLQSTIKITNAGDGLSQAMAIAPTELHLDDTIYVVLETTVRKVQYQELGDTGTLKREQVLKAGVATIVESTLVAEVLEAQRVAIEKARGVERIPFGEEGDDGGDESE